MPSSIAEGSRTFMVTWNQPSSAFATDTIIFTAPFECVVNAVNYVHSVASGTATKLQLTHDDGTEAPGAGDDLLSNNTNTGFTVDSTANTVQYGTFKAGTSRKLLRGDRLSLDFSGTTASLVGACVTVYLNRT